MAHEAVISVRDIRNQFGTQVIHDQLDLDIFRGEVLGIVGGSGTGKSVLLRTILGLNKPAHGLIELFGHSRAEMTASCAIPQIPSFTNMMEKIASTTITVNMPSTTDAVVR